MLLKIKPKIEETKSLNPLLQETFSDMKVRVFNENYQKLENLRTKYPKEFVGISIKKQKGLILQVFNGGQKIAEFFNNEILFTVATGPFVAFLKEHFKDGNR